MREGTAKGQWGHDPQHKSPVVACRGLNLSSGEMEALVEGAIPIVKVLGAECYTHLVGP